MQSEKIFKFLKDIRANNDKSWMQTHKGEYIEAKNMFEEAINSAIICIAGFDPSIKHITVKDATYRFNRDTRFSLDKSPYKTHFGAYVASHGKKAFHGGYYIHMEPGHCFLSCGNYWLPTNILTSCRNEIMANISRWRDIVEGKDFVDMFGTPGENTWGSPKGFGLEHLKTAPSGFPRDYEHIKYLRMKDYCCWRDVPDTFFDDESWLDKMSAILKVGKPMMDFINSVIDDYE